LTFSKPDFKILFFKALTFFRIFLVERLDSDKALPELYIHYKSLLTRVYDHAKCKEYCKDFTVVLKVLDIFNKKKVRQCNHGERKCFSRFEFITITSMFLTILKSILYLVMNVFFKCVLYAL